MPGSAAELALWGLTGALLGAFVLGWALTPLWLARRARKARQRHAEALRETVPGSKREAA